MKTLQLGDPSIFRSGVKIYIEIYLYKVYLLLVSNLYLVHSSMSYLFGLNHNLLLFLLRNSFSYLFDCFIIYRYFDTSALSLYLHLSNINKYTFLCYSKSVGV